MTGVMLRTLAVAASVALTASACGGSSTGGSGGSGAGGGAGGTLTVASMSPPASLDPAKANVGSDNWYVNLAYDTLLRLGPTGQLEPDLAPAGVMSAPATRSSTSPSARG